ncbi:hypothetical protein GIB67_029047 [Kingdonia uniflora]|uniref:Patatin n=1 Tax=Kingdonia uniflora TaxID=39325 RepID=A0A7J7N7A2_9MAGN|nr:hypothetical protein GIB67_029047 [Kingdonia uniflora]
MELSKLTFEIFSKLEQNWFLHCDDREGPTSNTNNKKTRILSIDGGGTKGFVSGSALAHLENRIQTITNDSNARIADFFDIVTGSGIGAVYAAMITADNGNGRPLFSANETVKFVTEKNDQLFKVKSVGLFRRKKRFSVTSNEKVLREAFKSLTLRDTCKPLLVPCYDLNSSAPFVFSRADASDSPSFDFELWKVCRATMATPTRFKPFQLNSVDNKTACLAIDGGLVMNNPTAAAITHVLHNKREFPSVNGVEDLLVLSLGNGPLSSPRHYNGDCSIPSVLDIVLDGVSETVDQMLGNAFCWNRTDYIRIQATGIVTEEVLKERGVESLPFGRKRLLTETNAERIEKFVKRIVASGRTSLPPSPCKDAVSPLINGR